MALKDKKIDAIIITATKFVIRKLLIALINMVLKRERQNGQSINRKKR